MTPLKLAFFMATIFTALVAVIYGSIQMHQRFKFQCEVVAQGQVVPITGSKGLCVKGGLVMVLDERVADYPGYRTQEAQIDEDLEDVLVAPVPFPEVPENAKVGCVTGFRVYDGNDPPQDGDLLGPPLPVAGCTVILRGFF